MKVWLNFDHSKISNKNLIMIFEGKNSHKNLLFDYFLPIQFIYKSTFLYFKSPLWKVNVLLLKNNYIGIFIIRLLIYNQFLFFNFINFIICYSCLKKWHSRKMTSWHKKWTTLICIHPPSPYLDKQFLT